MKTKTNMLNCNALVITISPVTNFLRTMASATSNLQVRVEPSFKASLKHAAELEGLKVSEYVVRNLKKCIEDTLKDENVFRLDCAQSVAFVEALMAEPRALTRLKAAGDMYDQLVIED